MKKLFYVLLALPMLMVACESESGETDGPGGNELSLTLTSSSEIEFSGPAAGLILYKLENAPEGALPTVTCEASWVTNINVAENIKFYVSYPLTYLDQDDQTTIKVEYEDQSFEVVVKRKANPIRFEAKLLDGMYLADTVTDNADNYYLYFTDNGFDSEGYFVQNSSYYLVDVYAELGTAKEVNGYYPVPDGTYTFAEDDSMAPGTIGLADSGYVKTATSVEVEVGFEAAELVVADGTYTLTVMIEGVKHIVTFSGEATIVPVR